MEFIDGRPLTKFIKRSELTIQRSVETLIQIADALVEAHKLAIIHRDLKPSNVIVDQSGRAVVVDFGLALDDDTPIEDRGSLPEGTPLYMAPEQIRGENHRINGQTDVWGFGVMMYQMLTGRRPFESKDHRQLARWICYREPDPPRQFNKQISRHLERICMRCISKLMGERYATMSDVLEDLQVVDPEYHPPEKHKTVTRQPVDEGSHSGTGKSNTRSRSKSNTQSQTSLTSQSLHVVPKGLRAFDQDDEEFFLSLLPGATDRNGIPDSIRFWTSRIASDYVEEFFSVGLIYGPSGCGKSSFVRAGLIPHLPKHIVPIYLESTAEGTEDRLIRQLGREFHSVDGQPDLTAIIRQFRTGKHLQPGDKLLLVLDQFEQWLYSTTEYQERALTKALRHCDGANVQCLLLVRDDFWTSISQFMRCLEIPIQEGHNALTLPLFDKRHAEKVLAAYGRAWEALPAEPRDLDKSQKRFIREAVDSLARRDKVICVRLAVFAEMMKDRPWNVSELNRIGGFEGAVVRYLNDIFSGPSVPPSRQAFEEPARHILEQLLPKTATTIKGSVCSRKQLQDGMEHLDERHQFNDVMSFLESDVKLISPIENPATVEASATEAAEKNKTEEYFHLTHDFLVNPIRSWLAQIQQDTWTGRAQIRFKDMADRWNFEKEARFLPTVFEYGKFCLAIPKNMRAGVNKEYWENATRRAVTRMSATVVALSLIVAASWLGWNVHHQSQAADLVREAMTCEPAAFSIAVDRVRRYQGRALGILDRSETTNDRQRLHQSVGKTGTGIGIRWQCQRGHSASFAGRGRRVQQHRQRTAHRPAGSRCTSRPKHAIRFRTIANAGSKSQIGNRATVFGRFQFGRSHV